MNIPKEIIEKAISGGWWPKDVRRSNNPPSVTNWRDEWILESLFWQALGKSCGWKIIEPVVVWSDGGEGLSTKELWPKYAHRFYDLILTGGDTEKFWEEILK